MVQRFLAQRPIEPFNVQRRVRRTIRDWDALNAHDFFEPKIEVTSVAKAFLTALLAIMVLPENPVVVVNQETRNLAPGRDFPNLLLDPSQARASRHVDDYYLPRCNLHDDEDIDDREESRVLRQQVAGVDLPCVILDESAPGLTVSWFSSAHHMLANCASRMVHAKLDCQFFGDFVLAPLGVVAADPTNQGYVLTWDAWTSGFARAPTPVALKATPVPCDYGRRPDDYQS